MNSIFRLHSIRTFQTTTSVTFPKRWKEKSEVPFQSELTNPVAEVYGPTESWPENEVRKTLFTFSLVLTSFFPFQFGYLFDKKPFKVNVKKYHLYTWCGCGRGHSQPFCDATCKNKYMRKNIVGGPITYIAPEDREVWFCMCKRTQHRPFCDGSHRDPEIQNTKIDGKLELWEPFLK